MANDKATTKPPDAPKPAVVNPCPIAVTTASDGSLNVQFNIEPWASNKIKLRANGMSLERYVWENILKQAVSSSVG